MYGCTDARGSEGRRHKTPTFFFSSPLLVVVGFPLFPSFSLHFLFFFELYVRFSCVLWAAHMTGNYLSSCQLCTVALCQDQNEESEDIYMLYASKRVVGG